MCINTSVFYKRLFVNRLYRYCLGKLYLVSKTKTVPLKRKLINKINMRNRFGSGNGAFKRTELTAALYLRLGVLPQQLHRLWHAIISPVNLVGVHFRINECCVIRSPYVAVSDGRHASWTAFELALAQLLWRGVDHLPAPVQHVQVRSGHPHLVPHVVVPEATHNREKAMSSYVSHCVVLSVLARSRMVFFKKCFLLY